MWDGFNVYTYPDADKMPADAHHRRTMYSFIKRNAPHPAMATFDLPERGGSTARRRTSNSPLQALVTLQDPQYLEAYRALASHVLKTERTKRRAAHGRVPPGDAPPPARRGVDGDARLLRVAARALFKGPRLRGAARQRWRDTR
jgi:hypothetical protein